MATHFDIWKPVPGFFYEINPHGVVRTSVENSDGLLYIAVKKTSSGIVCYLKSDGKTKKYHKRKVADLMLATWGFAHGFSKKRRDWINRLVKAYNKEIDFSVRSNTGQGVPKKEQHFEHKKDRLGRIMYCSICGKPLKANSHNRYYHQICSRTGEMNTTREDLFPSFGTVLD